MAGCGVINDGKDNSMFNVISIIAGIAAIVTICFLAFLYLFLNPLHEEED